MGGIHLAADFRSRSSPDERNYSVQLLLALHILLPEGSYEHIFFGCYALAIDKDEEHQDDQWCEEVATDQQRVGEVNIQSSGLGV